MQWRRPGPLLRLAGLYAVVGGVSFLVLRQTAWAAPLWPAAGIAFASVYNTGASLLPAVALGCFLLNLAVYRLAGLSPSLTLAVSAVVAIAVALQAALGSTLVRRHLGSRPPLIRGGEILAFLLLAGPVACLLGATIGVPTLYAAGLLTPLEVGRAWVGWWVGDAIGVIVFGPLTLMTLPAQAEVWRGRRWTVAVPSLIVLTIALAAVHHADVLEQRQWNLRLSRRADLAAEVLRSNLAAHEEVLQGIRSFVESTGEPSPQAFARFTASSLRRLPGLQAVSWDPLVPGLQLAAFEAEQRRRPGYAGFRVTERDGAGSLVPVHRRERHVPVAMIEPLAANRSALGFDIASNPVRARAIAAALTNGKLRATAPIQLIQERGTQKGVLLLLPVTHPRGFAVGVYRLGDLLTSTFDERSWDGFHIRLVDRTPGEPAELLGSVSPEAGRQEDSVWTPLPVFHRSIQVAGRHWQLEMIPSTALWGTSGRGASSQLRPVGGLLISGLLEGFLLLATGTEQQIRRELEQKLRTSLTAAAVAHEIKQPLARMLLEARAIEAVERRSAARGAEVSKLKAAAESISRDARQVSRTIDGIRDILGNVVSRLAPIDVAEPVEGALLVLKGELSRQGISLCISGLEGPHVIDGDREQLQVVLINLLRNAVEAAGVGGTVEILVREERTGVEIEVGDDGPGFPDDCTEVDSMFLASSKPEGTGLGLFVVRSAMENHHGSLHLGTSRLGGAAVRLRFPPSPTARPQRR